MGPEPQSRESRKNFDRRQIVAACSPCALRRWASLPRTARPCAPRINLTFRQVRPLAAGERAGLLPELLDKLGRFYLREVLRTRRMMARSLAPLLLMLPACVVLLIATAWFTAYTALVSAILGQM